MNFDDEDYVRVYTRDSPNWLRLSWEGQCVLLLTMRKVGRRSGAIELDGMEPAEALASVIGMPVEVVRVGLDALLARGTAKLSGGMIVLPKFLLAQWARRSDAARKRESRDSQRVREVNTDEIIAELTTPVTTCHTESHESQPVTSGHEKSPPIQSHQSHQSQTDGRGIGGTTRSVEPRSNTAVIEKKTLEKPGTMTTGWRPPDPAWAAAKSTFECTDSDLDRSLPEFWFYWVSGDGAGTKRGPKGWVRTWMNRLRRLAKTGELYMSRARRSGADGGELRPDQEARVQRLLASAKG